MTLAQLKRDAKSGYICGEMIIWFGDEEIPERLRGKRKIVGANSCGIKFQNADEKISELRIKCSSLMEYTNDSLIIYNPGKREMNEKELFVMREWEKISSTKEYKKRVEIDALSDGSGTYYQKKHFFEDSECPYLFGVEEKQGKKRDLSTNMIIDNSIKGEIQLKYKIYKNK